MKHFRFLMSFLLVQYVTGCKSIKTAGPINNLPEPAYLRVSLEDIIDKKDFFHNKYIETEGYYLFGFEQSYIEPVIRYKVYDSTVTIYDWSKAIWVDGLSTKNSKSRESYKRYLVDIRGKFDTSMHGHLSNYIATIKDAIIEYR